MREAHWGTFRTTSGMNLNLSFLLGRQIRPGRPSSSQAPFNQRSDAISTLGSCRTRTPRMSNLAVGRVVQAHAVQHRTRCHQPILAAPENCRWPSDSRLAWASLAISWPPLIAVQSPRHGVGSGVGWSRPALGRERWVPTLGKRVREPTSPGSPTRSPKRGLVCLKTGPSIRVMLAKWSTWTEKLAAAIAAERQHEAAIEEANAALYEYKPEFYRISYHLGDWSHMAASVTASAPGPACSRSARNRPPPHFYPRNLPCSVLFYISKIILIIFWYAVFDFWYCINTIIKSFTRFISYLYHIKFSLNPNF